MRLLMLHFFITVSTAEAHCGEEQFWRSTDCYYNPPRDQNTILMTPLDKRYLKNDTIFFIETSCHGGVDWRQACAIESAARAHPRRRVVLLMVHDLNTTCARAPPLAPLLHTHNNIQLYKIDIRTYLRDTPLHKFFDDGKFNKSLYPVEHLSDILRFATLYKFGGVYLDLDVIVAKPIDLLPYKDNFVVRESESYVGAGVVGLSRRGIGRVISFKVLRHLKHNFSPHEWSASSVGVLQLTIQNVCKNSKDLGCREFHVYQSEVFYPVSFANQDDYYREGEIPKYPYGFHLWNSATTAERYRNIRENTLLGRLMKQFCPISSENRLRK